MKILIIVHLEPMFQETAGSLDNLAHEVYLHSQNFDRVINVTCEGILGWPSREHDEESFALLKSFEQREWIWGFDPEQYQDDPYWEEGKQYIATTGHSYSEIVDWMRELPKDADYSLVGGGRNECLQDIYDIWNHLEYSTEIIENLTY